MFVQKYALCAAAIAGAIVAQPASAAVVYSNVTSFTGQGLSVGSANTVATSGTVTRSSMLMDDITPIAGFAGQLLTGFRFSLANFNGTATTFNPIVTFYAANGASGGPGTFLGGFNFNAVTVNGGSVSLLNFTSASSANILLPTGTFFASVAFSATGTAATVGNLGVGIFNPPTIGSSTDRYFIAAASAAPGTANPAGSFQTLGGNPLSNFGWEFTVADLPAAVPEPASWAMMIGGFGLVGAAMRRRVTKVSVAYA